MKNILITIFILFFTMFTLKASIDISGNMDAELSSAIKNGENYRKYLKLDLTYNKAFNNTEIKATVRAENDTIRTVDDNRIYIREAYVNQDIYFNKIFDSLNFKLGKIIYTWGNADELKPVDIINPQDLTYLLFKPIQDRKYGVFSGNLTLFFTEDIFLELVAVPEFKATEINSRVFIIKDIADIEANSLYTLNSEKQPSDNLHSTCYASRFGFSIFNIDSHLIYYKGYDHLPILEISLINPMTGSISFTPVYHLIEMFGFDFQRALFSGISVRGEIAYFTKGKYFSLSTEPKISTNPLSSPLMEDLMQGGNGIMQKKYTEYTFGFDVVNMFIKNLYANFQINGKYIMDYTPIIKDEKNINSFVGTLEYTFFRDKIKTKLRGFYNINDNAYAGGIEVGYKISGNYEVNSGLWLLDGKEDSYYGQFKNNDFAYISAKVIF